MTINDEMVARALVELNLALSMAAAYDIMKEMTIADKCLVIVFHAMWTRICKGL